MAGKNCNQLFIQGAGVFFFFFFGLSLLFLITPVLYKGDLARAFFIDNCLETGKPDIFRVDSYLGTLNND